MLSILILSKLEKINTSVFMVEFWSTPTALGNPNDADQINERVFSWTAVCMKTLLQTSHLSLRIMWTQSISSEKKERKNTI